VANITGRTAVNKQISRIAYGEFQSEEVKMGCTEKYRVELSNRFAALEEA
jgi:hypothetical protein